MSRIELSAVSKMLGRQPVLSDLDLVVEEGDFMTLLGPSGCGKTTTLRIIAGLESPDAGTVTIDDLVVADPGNAVSVHASKRGLNLVFQAYALWPHMTVFDNVAFGLRVSGISAAQIESRVVRSLERLQIAELRERYPSELSGGQQQRVAISRAIVTEPRILLLDEPLSNLDAKLRLEMRAELKRLHREINATIIYVTHDQIEALTLSTKVAVFHQGRLVQVDAPRRLYRYPARIEVAEFLGNVNIIKAHSTVEAGGVRDVRSPLGTLRLDGRTCGDDALLLTIHPEDVHVSLDSTAERGQLCTVTSVLPAGSETTIQLELADGTTLFAAVPGDPDVAIGAMVRYSIPLDRVNVYRAETGEIVSQVPAATK